LAFDIGDDFESVGADGERKSGERDCCEE